MAYELLVPNLDGLFNYCDRKFSLKTVQLLTDQLISRFQYIDSKGYILRDIKPDNLLMGSGKQGNQVYVTDIGLAREIDDRDRYGYPVVGTIRYASINAHLGKGEWRTSATRRLANIATQRSLLLMIWSRLDMFLYTSFEVLSLGKA